MLFAQAARLLGASEDALALRDKHVVGPEGRVSLADLARQSQMAGGGMIAHGTFIAPGTAYDTKRVEGHAYPAFHSPSFHVNNHRRNRIDESNHSGNGCDAAIHSQA